MLQSLVLQTKGFTDTQNDNARAFSCIGDLFNLLLQVREFLLMIFFFLHISVHWFKSFKPVSLICFTPMNEMLL